MACWVYVETSRNGESSDFGFWHLEDVAEKKFYDVHDFSQILERGAKVPRDSKFQEIR